jgi:hypothetical protein
VSPLWICEEEVDIRQLLSIPLWELDLRVEQRSGMLVLEFPDCLVFPQEREGRIG